LLNLHMYLKIMFEGETMDRDSIRPVRPTVIEFNDDKEMQRFIEYATSKRKTKNDALERVREGRKRHQRAKEMKFD